MLPEVQTLIDHFQMTNLPVEGTLYQRTWLSVEKLPDGGPVGGWWPGRVGDCRPVL